ncbi:MAG: histidine phosphatase family protein [Candidatus Buchananbacteria bacterium]
MEKYMKWPQWLVLIRHDVSEHNVLKHQKAKDPTYQQFIKAFETEPESLATVELARVIARKYALEVSDANTSLVDVESKNAKTVGVALKEKFDLPEVIFCSPYLRTRQTFKGLVAGWPELANVKTFEEERIREQDHGISSLYNDWRVFQTLHPEQRLLNERQGLYWYTYPQGENVPMLRDRLRSWINSLVRDYHSKKVLVITHHLSILGIRANLERLSEKEFMELDRNYKPCNCGVTLYSGMPQHGENGRLKLTYYNKKFY